MPEGQEFKSGIEQVEIDLKAPKTAEQWCKLYHELTGQNVYGSMNWGDEEKSRELLTYDEFQSKAKACQIDLRNARLITEANKRIQEYEP